MALLPEQNSPYQQLSRPDFGAVDGPHGLLLTHVGGGGLGEVANLEKKLI